MRIFSDLQIVGGIAQLLERQADEEGNIWVEYLPTATTTHRLWKMQPGVQVYPGFGS